MYVGQAKVTSLEAVSQPLVVEPQQVQQRRVQVMHMHRVAGHVESELIGLAINMTPPNPPTPPARC